MDRANRRRTRSSGSGVELTNGGEVTILSTDKVAEQSNASVLLKTPEKETLIKHVEEPMTNEGNGISSGVSVEESTPVSGKKSSVFHRGLVLGVPSPTKFETHRSSKKLGGGCETNVVVSSYKKAKEAAGSSSVDANAKLVDGPKKREKYMNEGEVRKDDEYTRIKKKLRYFLNRINYKQNLIDAYSLEGWKGSSVEKLRPEKELERAKKEILRRKVNIRELFQHLDTLCAEGSLPESLFDSGGEISSEDIFCAKCGSKDLSVDNDIILCDGFCDRGFHQYCVEPPLRKEDIPPDDESWLCPGCDCKDYSFDWLNDSLGTKLSVSDSWEKVFPEAAAAMAGGDQTLDCDLPSDDSEDEEYDPDGLNDNADDENGSDESENEDGSCDESDFTSDEMIESVKDTKDIMDLPSDDSEDDDYDPDAPVPDEDKMQESSNSDNTSDSEDPEISFKGDKFIQKDEGKPGRKKSQLPDVSISESDAVIDDDDLVDEEYENVSTSSSDDEDWDKTAGKEDVESAEEGDTVPLKQRSEAEDHTSTKKSKTESQNGALKAPQEAPKENGWCSGKKSSSAASNHTNPRTQRLFKSFQENQYPDIATRENLAKELQMTVKQVSSWFNNTRFSTRKTMASKEDVDAGNDDDDDGLVDVPGKKKVERMDYKKLYDEEHENAPTSSSDDEDWDKITGEDVESAEEGDTVPLKQPSKAEDHSSTKKPSQTPKRETTKDTLKAPQEAPKEIGSSGKKSSSAASKHTNPRTQRLFKSFQENQYPDIASRENLAKELQMTVKQVSSWFNNTRFSTRKTMAMASKEDVEKLRRGKECEGETSVTGSSEQTMETESVSENKVGASDLTNTGSRKRRRR